MCRAPVPPIWPGTGAGRGFEDYSAARHSQCVTQLIRLADSATVMQRDLICCTCLTHVLSGGTWVSRPHNSMLALRKDGGHWKAASVTNSYYNSTLVDPPSRVSVRPDVLADS